MSLGHSDSVGPPAIQAITEEEAHALWLAVTYALKQGLASDEVESRNPSNRSLVSVGRKLGCPIPEWCTER